MRSAHELYMNWNEFKEDPVDFVRRVQRDAIDAALAACQEVHDANLEAQDEPLDREEMHEAYGACDGAKDCQTMIRRLLELPQPNVPLGNTPAQTGTVRCALHSVVHGKAGCQRCCEEYHR